MSHMTPDPDKLVKARKAARRAFVMLIFGGGVISLYGVYTSYFPTMLTGLVLFAGSALPLYISSRIEKKLNSTLT